MNYGKEGNPTFLISIFFGFKCFILNTKDKLSKFNHKSDPSVFLGYYSVSKVYRIYNKKTQAVEGTIYISFKEKKKDIE